MRFNSPDEIKAWAIEMADGDYKSHRSLGADLNPYSTGGARYYWQRGFDNTPAKSWEHDLAFDMPYQRGVAAAKLLKESTR
jgi:hypothetical protein